MLNLTEEQKRRIEAKRQEALQRKRAGEKRRLIQNQLASQQTAASSLHGNDFKTPWATSSAGYAPLCQNSLPLNRKWAGDAPLCQNSLPLNSKWAGYAPLCQNSLPLNRKWAGDAPLCQNSLPLNSKWGNWNCSKDAPKPGSLLTATFELLSRERFLVNAPFDVQVIAIFKSIQSRSYDTKTKQWSFHVKDHDKVMHELLKLKRVTVNSIPSRILGIINNRQDDKSRSIDLSRIEPVLLQSLMPFQEEGIRFGISKGGRCLLADDMGLGKTIQALGIAHYYKEDWPLLIVAPSSLRYVWAEAIQKWLSSVKLCEISIVISRKEAEQIEDAQIVITSYNLIARCKEIFKKQNFSIFIMDESHYLKSNSSQRSRAALYLLKNAKRIIMLTGTPALSRPQELFVQLSALKPDIFSNMINFGLRYCAAKRTTFGWDFSGSSNMTELRLLLESQVMIRRVKSNVMTQLPPKIRQVVILDPKLVQSRSEEMVNSMKVLEKENLKGMKQRSALLKYYFATANAKVNAIKEYIAELLKKDKKFICFAHHQIMIDEICNLISQKGLEYVCINGRVASLDRLRLCDKFQLDDKCIAAVLSITAAGTGITLTAAYLVVFAELYWNPGILIQAEDRAHRIGQTDSVLIQYLIAQGTADDHLWPLIQSKYNVLSKAGFNREKSLETEETILQSKKHNPAILKCFEQMTNLDCEDENELLASMDMGEVTPKKIKLDYKSEY